MFNTQHKRLIWRSGFFLLFVLAPVFDLLRFDLNQSQLYVLGFEWSLGLSNQLSAMSLFFNLLFYFLLPIIVLITLGIWLSWKWGRLYCGWLCPHFSMVELINGLMRRSMGRLSLWDKETLPTQQLDGTSIKPKAYLWPITYALIALISFIWAVVLLSYLLPPKEIYGNLIHGQLSINQFNFIVIASLVFFVEFSFARHLFCRFGCALGIFQSMVWMGNKKGMVVAFNRSAGKACLNCDSSCEHACPMRLKPRGVKRHKFNCTQCMQCISACERVQGAIAEQSLLKMLEDECAFDVSQRGFGNRPRGKLKCFTKENQNCRSCQ